MNSVSVRSAFSPHFTPEEAVTVVEGLTPSSEIEAQSPFARIASVRRSIAARVGRKCFFKAQLFSDPAWDMLLELYVASLSQRRIQISRLTERIEVPATTALRWIAALEREGILERADDRLDGRIVRLSLTDEGRRAMDAYFETLPPETVVL